MARKVRLNFGRIGKFGAVAGFVFGLGYGVISGVGALLSWADAEIDQIKKSEISAVLDNTLLGVDFKIAGPNTLEMEEADVSYKFNFQTGYVSIKDGETQERIDTFSEFHNPALIDTFRQTACVYATGGQKKLAEFFEIDNFDNEDAKNHAIETRDIMAAFQTHHCQP